MKRAFKRWIVVALAACTLAFFVRSQNAPPRPNPAAPSSRTALRLTFGEKQERETDYSGALTLTDGRVTELIPWRFFGEDQLQGDTGWKLSTRRATFENQ